MDFFILFDKPEETLANEYIRRLREMGHVVFTPLFDADIMAVRRHHQESLRRFDVAIIVAVGAKPNWLNMKILEILKAPGMGRVKPILGKVIIASANLLRQLPPTAASFDRIRFNETTAMKDLDEFVGNALKSL